MRNWQEWKTVRAPELRHLVQLCEYGFLPPAPAQGEGRVLYEDAAAFGGRATLREIEVSWEMAGFELHLLLVTPNDTPLPGVFLGMNFSGNHSVVDDAGVAVPSAYLSGHFGGGEENRASELTRGQFQADWDIEATLKRGYGVATFFSGQMIPDEPARAAQRLRQFRRLAGAQEDPGSACGTIAVWAWALMRAVDYLTADPEIDSARIAVVGHSRNGKAAVLAGALDGRVALVIPNQAGCGGTAPVRVAEDLSQPGEDGRPSCETVALINQNFPHWFCDNFKSFNEAPERLPYDQHAMLALCAPRPLLVSAASEDHWANPAGQFEMVKLADAVYGLTPQGRLETDHMPTPGQVSSGRLGFFLRPGEHSMSPADWAAWRDFADKWMR